MTKSELRQMIRECLQEELQKRSQSLTEDTLDSGAKGGGNINQSCTRSPQWSCQPSKNDYLSRLKSKNPDLVSTMTVKGKDIKPGMITPAGQVKTAEVKDSGGKQKIYIMHTNNWDCFRELDQDIEVMADPDNKTKPFTGDYKVLLQKGLKESTTAVEEEDADSMLEGIFDFGRKKNKSAAQTSVEPEEEVPAWPEWDEEGAQRIADWKRKDEMDRKMKRAYNNSLMDKIKGDEPSNTPYRGVNYSGGDYY